MAASRGVWKEWTRKENNPREKNHTCRGKDVDFRLEMFNFFLFFLVSDLERVCVNGEDEQRERERESQAGSTLSTEPDGGLDSMTLGSWPEAKSRAGCSTDWVTQERCSTFEPDSPAFYMCSDGRVTSFWISVFLSIKWEVLTIMRNSKSAFKIYL